MKQSITARLAASIVMAGAALLAATAVQADYPERPVKLVVPFPAGGTADVLARMVGQKLGEQWGKPVVVENRPGALGVLGTDAVAKSAPDGYTIGLLPSSHAVAPLVIKKLPYDARRDLAALAPVATAPGLLVVTTGLPARTAKEAFDLARAQPNRFDYASPAALTAGHRSMELLKRASGAQIQHVPYKGGPPAVADLIAGQVQFMVGAIPSVIEHVKSGKLRALGVTTLTRFEGLPDVPTLAESGFPGFESLEWYGLYGPAGMPADVVRKVAADVQRALRQPEMRERFVALGALPAPGGPADLDRLFNQDHELWSRLINDVKLQAD